MVIYILVIQRKLKQGRGQIQGEKAATYRQIFADNIVYILLHYHTQLHRKGNILNKLFHTLKEIIILSSQYNFQLLV